MKSEKALYHLKCKRNILILSIIYLISCNDGNKEVDVLVKRTFETPIEIKFIGQWLNEGKREQLVRDVCREYEFTHQEVRIVLKFPEEVYYRREDQYSNQRFVAEILKKDQPEWDIIRINNDYEGIADFCKDPDWPKKYLVDFSEYPEFCNSTRSELISDKVKSRWHGIVPGPFIEGFNFALWFNKEVAQKIGIEIKQFNMTFDDFMSYLKKTYEYNQSHPEDYIIPFYEAPNWPTFYSVALQLYSSALNNVDEFYNDRCSMAKMNAWYMTLKSLEKLSVYKPLSPNWKEMEWWNTRNVMVDGKCLFYSNGSWMYNIWMNCNKSKIYNCVPAEYPSFTTAKTYIGGYQIIWAVLKNSKHRDEAVKFLLSWNNSDVADKWMQYTKSPTGIKSRFETSSFGMDQFEAYTQHIDKRYGGNKIPYLCDSRYIFGEKNKNMPNYYLEVLTGALTADEAFNKIKIKKYN